MIRITAPAKINFFLEITGRRPDGYHTLSTIFQTISLGDKLSFSDAPDLSLTCSNPNLPVDASNLVMKAAMGLREALKESRGARIHLEKKVPMGAGLGGGSSDAAAVLTSLLRLWRRRIGESALRRLAVSLGADVPFFLKGGLCEATGIGDKLKPLKALPQTWLVVVWPGFGVATKEAYAKVKLPFEDARNIADCELRSANLESEIRNPKSEILLFNRFESLVFPDHPELPRLKQELLEAGATASLMSGSGSSIFGLVPSKEAGERLLSKMQKKYNHCWLVHTI